MSLNWIGKTLITWITALSFATWASAKDIECKKLYYYDNNKIEKHTSITDWNWKIWEFTIEIKWKIVRAFIPNSEEDSYATLINYWNWDCWIWKAIID